MAKATTFTDDDLYNDDDLDLEVEDEDEFDALLAEADDLLYDEDDPRSEPTPAPACQASGKHELDGTATCVHCGVQVEVTEEPVRRGKQRQPGDPREPMMSGHCNFPQTNDPAESHQRCARRGAGNRACPDKVFAPCPCACHLNETAYECSLCGGLIYPAPLWTGTWIDPTDVDMVTFVHVVDGRAREECP